jgi:hypothetical protein
MRFPKLGLFIIGMTIVSGSALVAFLPVQSQSRNYNNNRYCPNYKTALYNLTQAQYALEQAQSGVRGERLDALQDIDRAKRDVRQAMQYRRCR